MQAAGTTAKQINVIVCSHMCWQGARLFWRGEGQLPLGRGGGDAATIFLPPCGHVCHTELVKHPLQQTQETTSHFTHTHTYTHT